MSNSSVQTVSSGADRARFWGALALAVLSVVAFYQLERQGALAQWGALAGGLALAVALYLVSESGRQLIALFADSWKELKKVVWPTRREAGMFTLYVFGFAVAMAFVLWVTDKTIEWVLYDLVLGWRK